MFTAAVGLTSVPTESLKQLLRLVYKDEATFPLTLSELARLGFQGRGSELMAQLRDHDAASVKAILICVLAERVAREQGRPVGILDY
jgi:hypothetical protein